MRPYGEEFRKLHQDYREAKSSKERRQLAKKYEVGFDTLRHWISDFDKEGELEKVQGTEIEVKYVPYPKFRVKPFRIAKARRDEEDIGILLGDTHGGRITVSYSPEIYQQRMDNYLEAVMDLINLHRPIRRAYVIKLGDAAQGENVHQGSKIGTTSMPVSQQIFDLIVPSEARFIMSLAQGVSEVIVKGVPGNHGVYDKTAPRETNWDNFLNKHLAMALQNQKNVQVECTDQFYQLFDIRGFSFFIIHGDQAKGSYQGVPLFALRRKYQEYYAYAGGFHYAYNGHFHTLGHDAINTIADFTINPPMVTGDDWALEKIGRASKPIQLVFGVHNKYGRTFEYKVYTDKSFLPRPFIRSSAKEVEEGG